MVEGRKALSLALDSVMNANETWNCCNCLVIMMEASLDKPMHRVRLSQVN